MSLPQLPLDKANHFVYGSAIGAVLYCVAFTVTKNPLMSAHCALLGTAVAGLLKEGVDAFQNWRATGNPMNGPHGVEWADAAVTAAGTVPLWAAIVFQSGGL